jgi:outer membrane protein OmpA-like peptidoglycan-associated protein
MSSFKIIVPSLVVVFSCLSVYNFAQPQSEEYLTLVNPSFEGNPKAGEVGGAAPFGWYDCGAAGESSPDIQPGFFEVTKPASNGLTYIGLVVRDNETVEGVGQRLSKPLEANQCYEFSIDLARAELYLSPSRSTLEKVNFVQPCVLRIWGGNGYCDRAEKLFETSIINYSRWLTNNIRVAPKNGNYNYIFFEAYFKTPILFPYNGHILIDNITPIKKLQCGPEKMPDPKPKVTTKNPSPANPIAGPKTNPAPKTETQPKKPETQPIVEKIERKNVKKGKIFRLEKVYFDANKYDLKPESEEELTNLYKFLRDNNDVAVEVGGHTNNSMWPNEAYAFELSTNRAKAVAEWLIAKGISESRVQYKGYGWKQPIQPNTTEIGKKKNQRVEVRILALNG